MIDKLVSREAVFSLADKVETIPPEVVAHFDKGFIGDKPFAYYQGQIAACFWGSFLAKTSEDAPVVQHTLAWLAIYLSYRVVADDLFDQYH